MLLDDAKGSTDPTPFVSVTALKTAHAELLKQYRLDLDGQSVHREDSELLLSFLPEIKLFMERGKLTGSIIDAEDDRVASQAFLDYWASVLYRAGVTRDEKVHDDATLIDFDPDLAPVIDEDRCPYIGLDAFQEQNTAYFHGRKWLIKEMLQKLETQRLLAVVGPSGSGKSSVVLAGLIPQLKAGALRGSETWNYYPPIVPSANPLRSLALAVRPKGKSEDWVNQQVELFKKDPRQLLTVFEQSESSASVLIIDQFEEVFTLCSDEQLLNAFVQNLLAVASSEKARHRIVVTMRIEFQEQLPRLDELYPLMLQGLIQVLPLSATDLRDVIERPAAGVGLKFEKGVVDGLVKEIVGEPAGLPLLQFTLLELWRRRRRNRVLFDDYNRLGGARKALTNVASSVYAEFLPQEQQVAKRIFLRLSWTGETVEVLRNRVTRKALHQSGGSSDQVDTVLRKLVAARLVRVTKDEFAQSEKESPNDQFEVAHEALIRNWQLLIDWLQVEHSSLRLRIRVRSAAEQWLAHRKDPGGLLGGSLLLDAEKYTDLDDLEKEFINASKNAEQAAKDAKESAREREVSNLQALATEQARSARLMKVYLLFTCLGLVVLAGMVVLALFERSNAQKQRQFAEFQSQQAERQRKEAEVSSGYAKKLAEKAEASRRDAIEAAEQAEFEKKEADKHRDIATRLQKTAEQNARSARVSEAAAREAEKQALAAQTQAEKSKQEALTYSNLLNVQLNELNEAKVALVAEYEKVRAAKVQADENYMASVAAQSRLNVELRAEKSYKDAALNAASTVTSFSADGSKLLTFPANGSPRVWDIKSKSVLREGMQDDAAAAALSSDGRLLAIGGLFSKLTIQDVASGKTVFEAESGLPRKLIFSADSQKLAVLDGVMGTVRLFDIKTKQQIGDLGDTTGVVSVAFSKDSRIVALTTANGESFLVNVEANNQVGQLALDSGSTVCRESKIDLLDFSPSIDLRASLRLETTCQETDAAKAPNVAPALNPKQVAAATTPVEPDEIPSTSFHPPSEPPLKIIRTKPGEPAPLRRFRLILKVYRRIPDLDKNLFDEGFSELCSVDYSTVADKQILEAFEELERDGISRGEIRDISNDINDLAQKFSKLQSDPERQKKYQQLTTELLYKIMDELDIPRNKGQSQELRSLRISENCFAVKRTGGHGGPPLQNAT
jgi:energy-coupling factor transporter ATP-binding protein EcfA2